MNNVKIIFSEAMNFDVGTNTFLTGIKGGLVTKSCLDTGLPIEIIPPVTLSRDVIKLAHDAVYVDEVLDLKRDNGCFNRSPDIARALPIQSGAFVTACEIAFIHDIAIVPYSGFHHAEYAKGQGLCTFNGTMIAALNLRKLGKAYRIAIVDTDLHYGDGTDQIINYLDLKDIFHYSTGRYFYGPSDHVAYMEKMRQLPAELTEFAPDILLFQAGGDSHLEDPYVGPLSTLQMYERDKIIFDYCKAAKLPVAVSLSGGYQIDPDGGFTRQVRLHVNTIRAALRLPVVDDMTEDDVRFARMRVRPEPFPDDL
jgi:acetoin utilization deacetylase AcuC-like enzyme